MSYLCAGNCCLTLERTELDEIPEVLLKLQVTECHLSPEQPAHDSSRINFHTGCCQLAKKYW